MSTVTHPIRELLKSDVTFCWRKSQEEAFDKIKSILSAEPVLTYYDVAKPVTISCDASQSGLGALLLQPAAYASRALTALEPPKKVKAIREMPPPTDKKGIERLLGTINYLAKFITNMSTVTHRIRELLKSDVTFCWKKSQEEAFDKINSILSAEPVLTYYDVAKPVTISCDASQSGLGALLLQPVAYASRALTDAETRYAQIEKELLDVVFVFNRFHQYVYGKETKGRVRP